MVLTATESGEVVRSKLQKLDGFVVSGGLPFENWTDVCGDVEMKIEDDGSVILFKPEQTKEL